MQDLEIQRQGNEVCLDRNHFGFKADLSLKENIFKNVTKACTFGSTESRKQGIHEAGSIKKIILQKQYLDSFAGQVLPWNMAWKKHHWAYFTKGRQSKEVPEAMAIFTVIIIDLISSCPDMLLALQPLTQ